MQHFFFKYRKPVDLYTVLYVGSLNFEASRNIFPNILDLQTILVFHNLWQGPWMKLQGRSRESR